MSTLIPCPSKIHVNNLSFTLLIMETTTGNLEKFILIAIAIIISIVIAILAMTKLYIANGLRSKHIGKHRRLRFGNAQNDPINIKRGKNDTILKSITLSEVIAKILFHKKCKLIPIKNKTITNIKDCETDL